MNTAPLVVMEDITKRFSGVVALSGVRLAVERGECRAICGENGAGKSTLMKVLAGIETDFEGRVLLEGQPVRFAGPRDARAAGISVIHQELSLVEELSVAANVFLGRELRTRAGLIDNAAMEQSAAGVLAELGCNVPPDRTVGELRTGDQQLVEIARAISLESKILIMDEPTSALTEAEAARLYAIIADLRQRGVTVLYISHKLDEIFRLCNRVTVLRDGRLVASLERDATDAAEIARLMVGREIAAASFQSERAAGEVVLQVERLSLSAPEGGRARRLEGITFQLRRGEILGIAGLMGAGRTELLECLFGASPVAPTGRILLDGRPVVFRHPADAVASDVALVTEDRKRLALFPDQTVGVNITIAMLRRYARLGVVDRRKDTRAAGGAMQRLAIKASGANSPVEELSGGNQQKAVLARWLIGEPRVLLLDDPTRGIDVGAKAELYRLLDALRRGGLAIVMTSSELPELLVMCDRILVLCEGRQVEEFARGEATEELIMAAAAGLRGGSGSAL
jgi:ABC-type sugar transport system ATPase subunit